MRMARGPFSLTINHEFGLLVHGFDEPHVVRTNHSPPHYAAHVEGLGYRKAIDLVAYVCRVADATWPERVERVVRRRVGPELEFHSFVADELEPRLPARSGALQRRLVR